MVDDEPNIRRLCDQFLTRLGYRVDVSETVEAAHELVSLHSYDIVLTDLRLPGLSGLDLLKYLRSQHPATRTLLMSGKAEASDAAAAVNEGVDGMLLKPFGLEELRTCIERSLVAVDAQHHAEQVRDSYEALLRQRQNTSKIWILRAAHALATAVEVKDAYTAGHARRVTAYAVNLISAFPQVELAGFRLGCQLHDVGKIGIPDAILNKTGRLTAEETEAVRSHPCIGARILEPLIDDPVLLGMVRWHHERWDGTGYPDRLVAGEIPAATRVLTLVDTLDAMTSARSYRTGQPWNSAIREILNCKGTQFDPAVVSAMEAQHDVLERLYRSFTSAGILR